jgi:hypothetical protein
MDINYDVEIAERIMGWKVYPGRFYSDPNQPQDGPLGKLPDFVGTVGGHSLLREALQQHGDELTVTQHEPTHEIGKLFTARLVHHGQIFEETRPDDRVAVCDAALRAYGHVTAT